MIYDELRAASGVSPGRGTLTPNEAPPPPVRWSPPGPPTGLLAEPRFLSLPEPRTPYSPTDLRVGYYNDPEPPTPSAPVAAPEPADPAAPTLEDGVWAALEAANVAAVASARAQASADRVLAEVQALRAELAPRTR